LEVAGNPNAANTAGNDKKLVLLALAYENDQTPIGNDGTNRLSLLMKSREISRNYKDISLNTIPLS
jgi:hypothetical protein